MKPFRQLFRLYLIGATLLRHGVDQIIPRQRWPLSLKCLRIGLFWLRNQHPDASEAKRLRLAMEALGPVFIKLGQMLSTRRDLLNDDYAEELALLQDQVAPFPGEQALALIEASLGYPLTERFSDFDETPLATASIAQVHTATLLADEQGQSQQIVLKVIRPGIDKQILADLHWMESLAELVARLLPDGKRLRPKEVIREYRKTILDELDMAREAANAIQLRRNFEGSDALYVPRIYSDYCRPRLLVMERVYGIPVGNIAELEANGTNMKRLAERGVEVFFTQVFRDSFFHADMHPGNIFVAKEHPEDPLWIGIDCGIVGTLNREDKRYLAENFLAFFNRDYRKVAELHVDSGWVPADTSIDEFEVAIRTVCEPIFNKPLSEISFGHVLINLFNTARRFNMEVQPQLVLLQKTLLYIEGLGRQLYPQLDLWQTAKPFLEDWMQDQLGAKALKRNLLENLPYWGEKLPQLPDLIFNNLQQAQQLLPRLETLSEQYHQQADRRSRSLFWLGTSAIIALITLFFDWPSVTWSVLGWSGVIGCWISAWRFSSR
ncbi:ubiquinone biosynthesis regulatory protein kinase UbiB [Corallincola spongiicola]|uniref:Probable protein kinase UbiB n=1 Tax=Corallincola spongiicola TaxID=2520508 RepID=A0ABY1WL61_9GAMM|nr:ubiquinone biosynthesis regulatory protein kinase UbiB [Corallincola spongiicola]TAA41004.1 ubiquinone biosynthesis regulatory protein kinase UbiB [Corallincola spongiicola]